MNLNSNGEEKAAIENNLECWFATSELLEYLGISETDLIKEIELLTEGIHYKHLDPNNPRSEMLWRVDLIDETLCLPIPPLEREAMKNAISNHIICN